MLSIRNAHLVRDGEIIQTVKATIDGYTTVFDPPIGPFSKNHDDQIKLNMKLPNGRPPQ